MANPNWKKGVSGNPNGRPPKSRALTEILARKGGSRVVDVDGKQRGGKHIVARALWELAATGKTELMNEDGVKVLEVGAKGWFEIVKWLYSQIDGPPRQQLDIDANVTNDEDYRNKLEQRLLGLVADRIASGVSGESEPE